MSSRCFFILIIALAAGCRERTPVPTASTPIVTNTDAPAVVAEPDMSAVLGELTQALRRFSAEKQTVPASLDALVAAGYIQGVPQAPAGKVFAIDSKNVRVILR